MTQTAKTTRIEPRMSAQVICKLKSSTEPIVADIGSKASIKLNVVASIYFRTLLAR